MDGFTVSRYLNPVRGVSEAFRPCAVTDLKKRTETVSSTPACLSQLDCAGGRQLAPSSHMGSSGCSATVSPSLCRPVGFVCYLDACQNVQQRGTVFHLHFCDPNWLSRDRLSQTMQTPVAVGGSCWGLGTTSGLDLAAALQHPRLCV